MTQNEKDLLAKFATSTDEAIKQLTRLLEVAANEITDLRQRVFGLERHVNNMKENNNE